MIVLRWNRIRLQSYWITRNQWQFVTATLILAKQKAICRHSIFFRLKECYLRTIFSGLGANLWQIDDKLEEFSGVFQIFLYNFCVYKFLFLCFYFHFLTPALLCWCPFRTLAIVPFLICNSFLLALCILPAYILFLL